ncbi:MAG TPA: M23 family metallopeptidase [Vicinamibacterales bacterium]
MTRQVPIVAILVALTAPFTVAQQPESSVPIEIVVPTTPIPVRGASATHLVYELHLTNFRNTPLELTHIEVMPGDDTSRVLASYSGQEITSRLLRPGTAPNVPDKQVIAGGMRAILMLELTIEGNRPVPSQLRHRLTFSAQTSGAAPTEQTMELPLVTVGSPQPLVIAPPLRGGDWLAANGPSNTSVHRRALLVVNGTPHIAQRFAIDWIKIGPGGRIAHDDRSRNENWFGYGEEVLAVADGTVVATKDGIPENVPMSDTRAVPITLDTIVGNVVVVDIGNGRYATFAHLIPKSLRVSVGAKVRRGQVLGRLGNSGNSDAPHLHFHITDGPSAMGSEGVPYIFESVQDRGTVPSLDTLVADEPWIPQGGTVVRTREIPMENAVIRFK